MSEIFLSYSRQDQVFADSLTGGLQHNGLQVWVDRNDIQAGDAWRTAISRAIAACDAFLVVLSPNSVASKNVPKELSIAESHDRHIVPIMYQKCQVPADMDYPLAGLQWIDFPEMGFDRGLDRLVATLRGGKPKSGPDQAFRTGPSSPPPPGPTPSGGYSNPQGAQPAYAPQSLPALLCGRWTVQIGAAFGPAGQALVDIFPDGTFRGQLTMVSGMSVVAGQWQLMPNGQLLLQGQQTVGWASAPYVVMIQFTNVTPGALSGITGAGEQVSWMRVP